MGIPLLYDESQGNVFRRHIKTDPNKQMLAEHRRWMDAQQKEYPMPYVPYRGEVNGHPEADLGGYEDKKEPAGIRRNPHALRWQTRDAKAQANP